MDFIHVLHVIFYNYYKNWAGECSQIVKNIKKKIEIIKKEKIIIGYGAAAKANTFLNFYGLDNKIVNYITDSSTNKIGKYTPLTRIPIEKDQIIKKFKNPNIIFTAWNVSDNLKKIIGKINPKYTELKPYEN